MCCGHSTCKLQGSGGGGGLLEYMYTSFFLLTVRRIRMFFSLKPSLSQGESSLKISDCWGSPFRRSQGTSKQTKRHSLTDKRFYSDKKPQTLRSLIQFYSNVALHLLWLAYQEPLLTKVDVGIRSVSDTTCPLKSLRSALELSTLQHSTFYVNGHYVAIIFATKTNILGSTFLKYHENLYFKMMRKSLNLSRKLDNSCKIC